jgi:hypothetical protein
VVILKGLIPAVWRFGVRSDQSNWFGVSATFPGAMEDGDDPEKPYGISILLRNVDHTQHISLLVI